MLAQSDIHRSISRMTLDLHRAIDRRKRQGDAYAIAEREYQTQCTFSGTVGTLPVETTVTIPFTLVFIGDPGNQRDSTLDRPHARLTTEILFAPAGAVPYAYVSQWQRDEDFNFIGAVITIGVNCPAMYVAGADAPANLAFKGILHAAFQGFGAMIDYDSPFDISDAGIPGE